MYFIIHGLTGQTAWFDNEQLGNLLRMRQISIET
jgi:hypothetical protein